jgi:two-component system sensor histidine kinase PilS (NtrC family)
VRNPLAGIRGAMQVLEGRLPEHSSDRRVIDEVIARVDTLNDIVGDLLSYAQPRPLALQPTSVGRLVKEVAVLLQDDPRFAAVRIETAVTDDDLEGDPEQLKRALLNLLLNAAQAMPDGGTIRVDAVAVEDAVEIQIADTGRGIPEGQREHLFEPFFTTKTRGTGLGLATTRRIIERHGGTIGIGCPASGGAVVTIRLLRHPANPEGDDRAS